jgi:subtilisin family serine protease/MFS family permease
MVGRSGALASAIVLLFLLPLASSTIVATQEAGGFDAEGVWSASVEHDVHPYWWLHWSRDKDANELDDRLEWLLEQPAELQQDWWRRAPPGSARVFVDYNHHPTDADVSALEGLGVEVTFRFTYLDTVSATAPFEAILDSEGIRSLPGVVMVEDLGLAEPNMHEAVPNMGVDDVWNDLGLDGTGSVIAILDTGVRGDHEGLNDMDDDPFTCIDDPPDPLDPNPEPIPADCDPKIIAFFDAVFTDEEHDPSESYDSGTHGSHVAGIAAGSGGGQSDPSTGLRYVGAAPGAYLVTILACCDGDIEDVMQGAQWAIDNKDKHGIDIVTSSLGEQQFEIHVDNDGNSAWSRQMDMVVEAGIITTLSAGNEFGGATFAGCNTIDSPGDARLPVTVASLDKDLGLAIYSSRGYTSDLRIKPDVAAIGSSIMAPDALTKDGYTSKSGTSMATPLMAGIAALMVQANPDITPTEFKDIIGAYSIEREIAILDDPGFNDCSLLETRPDNEFGYGQADPVAFVEAAGSIDRSLNISMDVLTLQEIGNESYIAGTSSGGAPGLGLVEVKVGGGEWKGAADLSKNGDWATWRVKLDPHLESGNSTIYARLKVSEDSISPIDARRVILIDGELASGAAEDLISIGSYVFFVPFALVMALLGFIMTTERWDRKFLSALKPKLKPKISSDAERFVDAAGSIADFDNPGTLAERERRRRFRRAILAFILSFREFYRGLRNGEALTENKASRTISLCILYVAQGLPSGFANVAFVAFLVTNGIAVEQIALLFATVYLPWTFKFIWGPVIDMVTFPQYGIRRPWVLFAETGMIISLATLLMVPDLVASIELVTILLFIHNLFSSLQDVSVDALAVDILEPDEVATVNGLMFASKRGGIIFGGAVLGMLVVPYGIKSAIMVQLPLLVLIMMVPLFLRERPSNSLFPWSKKEEQEEVWYADTEEVIEAEEALPWEADHPEEFTQARWVATNLYESRMSPAALILWLSIGSLLIWGLFAILHQLTSTYTGDWALTFGDIAAPMKSIGKWGLLTSVLLMLAGWLGASIPDIRNPMPASALASQTAYNIVKGFSTRSSFILIFLCLLSELYLFTDPIVVDIFINEAGWSQTKYNAIVGGVVIAFMMFGQIVGGMLGDRFGVREVSMIGFSLLALSNASLALMSDYWTNTNLMVGYLCVRAVINGVAWICVIAVAMRLTFSKAGGSQFTAYMSMFNLSAVMAYLFTGNMTQRFDYVTCLYIGGALTLFTVVLLWFIDPDEVDRTLEGRFGDGEDEFDGDLGERPEAWYEEDEAVVTS